MTLQYQGNLTIGEAVPTLATAGVTLVTSLTPTIADLNARIAGQTTASIAPPQLITDLIVGLTASVASLVALANLGFIVLPPTFNAALETLAALELQLAALEAGLEFALDLPLSVAGVHLYASVGKANTLGADFTAALSGGLPGGGGGDAVAEGVHLLADTAGASDALREVFGL